MIKAVEIIYWFRTEMAVADGIRAFMSALEWRLEKCLLIEPPPDIAEKRLLNLYP